VIITVAHQKGGVGKSTIATNLAVEMKLPIIDLDSQHSCYLFSLLREEEHGKSLKVFTPQTPEEIKEILKKLPSDKVVVDSGGYDNDLNRFALLISDVVLTPVSPSQIEVFGLLRFAEIVKEAKKYNSSLKVCVVINNAVYANAGEDVIVCDTDEVAQLLANDPLTANGNYGYWQIVSGYVDIADSTSYSTTVTNVAYGSNTLKWTVVGNGCQASDVVIVSNNHFTVSAGTDRMICDTTTILVGTDPGPDGSGLWTVSGSGWFEDEKRGNIEQVFKFLRGNQ